LLKQFVAANAVARFLGWNGLVADNSFWFWPSCCRRLHECTGPITGLQEFFDTLTQDCITGARFIKICATHLHRQMPGNVKDENFASWWIIHVQTASLSAH
jgi:hypothetical protein